MWENYGIQGGILVMLLERDLTYRIRACVFEVYGELGHGFLERVYENALSLELRAHGLQVRCQVPVDVRYKGSMVGQYFSDVIVDDRVLLELKAQERLPEACELQLLNYLKASGIRVGMLINFAAPQATIRRMIL